MTSGTLRDRMVVAAFELFAEQGYEATTADQIAARAGAGRTTFFRVFGSKDDVALVDHEEILRVAAEKLATAADSTRQLVAREAARIVLDAYMAGGALARRRSQVVAQVPALRDRELVVMARYQRLFYEHFRLDPAVSDPLTAELLAAAWVTTHNHVLRRWLARRTKAPADQLDAGLVEAYGRLVHGTAETSETAVLVFRTSAAVEEVLPALQSALRRSPAKR